MINRRQFLKLSAAAGAAIAAPVKLAGANGSGGPFAAQRVLAAPAAAGLSDPALQPKFVNQVPDALDPSFKFSSPNGKFRIAVGPSVQMTGLVDPGTGMPVPTPVYGYGQNGRPFTWPGRTFEVQSGVPIEVKWENKLGKGPHLLTGLNGQSVVDTSLHWAYSLPGYEGYSIEKDGVPIVTHLHGGHTDSPYDGNPEFFFSPGYTIRGPQWVDKKYIYHNDQPAGNLWYHDHALGITRLNVYAGMAGFYFVRDEMDTGKPDNPLGLPAWPYEKAYAIQDRMFKANGELFYPAFPGDPAWDDFITGEVPPELIDSVPQPSALAEFFGDHMVVNGMIWPKEDVERRNYRLHLLNGTDSRFMAIRFRQVDANADTIPEDAPILPFWVIGSDQGLGTSAQVSMLLSEPGGRYDIVFDFSQVPMGKRVIMENIGGDEPFGGDIPGPQPFGETDRIMAFDVVLEDNQATAMRGLPIQEDVFDETNINFSPGVGDTNRPVRQVALFEGKDEYGRLQPLLGTNVGTPEAPDWKAIAWHSPTTENPDLDATEEWAIYNFTGDAHPVHLHLVHFEILGRQSIFFDSDEGDPGQPVLQHNGLYGKAPTITNVVEGADVNLGPDQGYVENAPKDMVTALPEQVTRIKATFDKPGRYVWHCHILSHEDHEMMRVLHVGPGA
jgi:FtsP/CotA-like multicopper oxidase with cupredoxin domain